MIEIAKETLKFIDKDRNGDYCLSELMNEGVLIAAVADGVSRQPCDWKASQMACEQLIKHFKSIEGIPLAERLRESMIHANEVVCSEKAPCNKMSATLSTTCLDIKAHKLYFGNVGDSRIYRVRDKKIDQLTKDDKIPRKKVIMTKLGRRTVDASVLTKNLGMDTSILDFQVHEITAQSHDLYILASDGFYEARVTFQDDMITLADSINIQQDFQLIFKRYSLLAGDDITAVIFQT